VADNFSKTSNSPVRRIVFFDGYCLLCQASVQFIIQRDPSGLFQFAPLQEELANKLLAPLPESGVSSVILWEEGKISYRSTAALRIVKKLRGVWPLLYVLTIVPVFIRDGIYNWVAKNRYKWWGKSSKCLIPKPEWKERFPTL
jgi:predicted DCC family thiol-disulfide oxidoreductase YuxK